MERLNRLQVEEDRATLLYWGFLHWLCSFNRLFVCLYQVGAKLVRNPSPEQAGAACVTNASGAMTLMVGEMEIQSSRFCDRLSTI